MLSHNYACDDVLSECFLTECLITHLTGIRAHTTMYALMFYQTTLYTECLITHFTGIRALTTM